MNTRIAKGSHLGERRFLEYPQFEADELGQAGDVAQQLLAVRAVTPRRALGATLLLLAALAGALLLLR